MSRIFTGFLLSTLALPTLMAEPPRSPSHGIVGDSAVPCGIAAPISAAREGAKVVLVGPMRHVGGLGTSHRRSAGT